MPDKRRAAARLRELIDSADELPGILPLVHITDAYRFLELAGGDELVPTECHFLLRPPSLQDKEERITTTYL